MLVVVSYDISRQNNGEQRLSNVSKICKNYGQRVQHSIFECLVDPAQWVKMKQELIKAIDPKNDCLRIYYLGSNWKRKIEHIGLKKTPDFEEPLIF